MRKIGKLAALLVLSSLTASPSFGSEKPAESWVAEVSGMSCPLCANNIEKQLKKDPSVISVEVDLGKGEVRVTYAAANPAAEPSIRKAVERAGFTVGRVTASGDR